MARERQIAYHPVDQSVDVQGQQNRSREISVTLCSAGAYGDQARAELGLENRCALRGTLGSNPSLSAAKKRSGSVPDLFLLVQMYDCGGRSMPLSLGTVYAPFLRAVLRLLIAVLSQEPCASARSRMRARGRCPTGGQEAAHAPDAFPRRACGMSRGIFAGRAVRGC